MTRVKDNNIKLLTSNPVKNSNIELALVYALFIGVAWLNGIHISTMYPPNLLLNYSFAVAINILTTYSRPDNSLRITYMQIVK